MQRSSPLIGRTFLERGDAFSVGAHEKVGIEAKKGFGLMERVRPDPDIEPPPGLPANTGNDSVAFFVQGVPAPGGSKSAFPFRRKNGKMGAIVVDAGGKKTKEWRKTVAWVSKKATRRKLQGPLRAIFGFNVMRPKSHMDKRGVKPDAPIYPDKRPDCTKLVRSTEDAMTGIVYDDDAQIVQQHAKKTYVSDANLQGCSISISELLPRES